MSPSRTWDNNDFPVLKAIVELLESVSPGMPIQMRDVESSVDSDQTSVGHAISRLKHEHLIVKPVETFGDPIDYIIKDVTPKGLRAVGAWPNDEAAARAFLSALDQQIEEAPEGSEKKSALTTIRESAGRIAEGTLTTVFSAAVKGGAGL